MSGFSEEGTIHCQAVEDMDCELEACVESTQKCLLIHGNKRNSSPVIISFFKVMYGKQFSKIMELPPKVASVLLLTDQETFLEDSRRLKWKVSITCINGSFAFQQGWDAFSLDHNLQIGDFLVFNYIIGSHFTVKIYDDTGCEVNFSEIQHQKKRKRENRDSSVKDDWWYKIGESSMRQNGSGICAVPNSEIRKCLYEVNGLGKAEYAEELGYMINREYGDKQEVNRVIDLDFSNYEREILKKIKISGSDGSNKVSAVSEACFHHDDSTLGLRNEPGSVKIPMAKEVLTTAIPSDTSEFEGTEKKDDKVKKASASDKDSFPKTTSGHLCPMFAAIPEPAEEVNCVTLNTISDIPNRAIKECQTADASGKVMKIIEKETAELTSDQCSQEVTLDTLHLFKKVLSGNDSCTKTSGLPFLTHSLNPKENEEIVSDISNRATKEGKFALGSDLSGNDQLAVPGKEHDVIDYSFQREETELTGISESCDIPFSIGHPSDPDKVMMINEREYVELTSEPNSREVIVEKNDMMEISEKGPAELPTDPCNEEVIPDKNDMMEIRKIKLAELPTDPCIEEDIPDTNDKTMEITENVLVELTSGSCSQEGIPELPIDPCNEEVIPDTNDKKMEVSESVLVELTSGACSREVIPDINGAVPLHTSEFGSPETINKFEAKVKPSEKDSCTKTSGLPFPTLSLNPKENEEIVSDISNRATKEGKIAPGSGNDQLAVSRKEHEMIDDSSQRANIDLTGISESRDVPLTTGHQSDPDKVVMMNEREYAELTSEPNSQEVISEKNDKMRQISEKEPAKLTSDPCSEEVIPVINDKTTVITESVLVELTSGPCSQEVIPDINDESLNVCNKVDVALDTSEFGRPETINKSEAKVNLSDKDSCTKTSGLSFPTHSLNPEENEEITSDISDEATKKGETIKVYHSTAHNLSIKRNLTASPSDVPDFQRTEIEKNEENYPDILNRPRKYFRTSNGSGISLESSYKLHSQSEFARESKSVLQVVKPEPIDVLQVVKPEPIDVDSVPKFPSSMISFLVTAGSQSFVELPEELPLPKNKSNRSSIKQGSRIVYLQGSDNRNWPALYIQKLNYRALTQGWKAFCIANNIEPGHQCTFEVISPATPCICHVQVISGDEMAIFDECLLQPFLNLPF